MELPNSLSIMCKNKKQILQQDCIEDRRERLPEQGSAVRHGSSSLFKSNMDHMEHFPVTAVAVCRGGMAFFQRHWAVGFKNPSKLLI